MLNCQSQKRFGGLSNGKSHQDKASTICELSSLRHIVIRKNQETEKESMMPLTFKKGKSKKIHISRPNY